MEKGIDHVRLVEQAQQGDKKCLEQLAKLAQECLQDDVYRMTLKRDLAEDIVQETILQMLKMLGKLREADRFWPWLYQIALSKVRLHHRAQRHRSTVPISASPDPEQKNGREAMSELAAKELKQIIFNAMEQLKPQHRAVLTMRCYREMEFSVIAESLGCSEFAARKLFWRGKRALQRQLSRAGFGKGSLLMALALFGKMTASSEAAVAKVSVAAGVTKVGAAAAVAAMASTKTAVISLAAAGAIGAGVLVAASDSGPKGTIAAPETTKSQAAEPSGLPSKVCEEYFYYPEGRDGPLLMRSMQGGAEGGDYSCRWVQDAEAVYYFDRRDNSVRIENYRPWREDLSVRRLPTDSEQLQGHLSQVAAVEAYNMQYTTADGAGLLVVVERAGSGSTTWATWHRHVLEEEYFRYTKPAGAKVIDNRDAMHKRGWTYFRIEGRIDGDRVSGAGRIPFVYAAAAEHHRWLRLNIADRLEIIDDARQAITRRGRKVTASYEAGSFFAGLSRPWMGLHTIDTVRRDAAEREVAFETRLDRVAERAEIVLTAGKGRLVYTI
ncbi:MAG: RNA polymerase sigma factor, partial [Planctomycetota bacterium]